jgi:hypothetical protein
LAESERELTAAEQTHDEAAALIDAHLGFNAGGKVIDRQQALETVRNARAALREARQTLRDALRDLRDACRAWREDHPRPQPAATPTGG